MKRRNVLLGGVAAVAAPSMCGLGPSARADTPDAGRLTQDLTPLGAERAGSASGSVPAWTGGGNTSPPGWSPGMIPPDPFPGEKPLFSVTAANVDNYADMLSEGQKLMFEHFGNKGYRMDVYPSHRTACAPQYVYDNTAKNIARAQPVPDGILYGFTGAFGGVPFPILSADPSVAGVQAMWNHQTNWQGFCVSFLNFIYVIANGSQAMTSAQLANDRYPYYDPDMNQDENDGAFSHYYITYVAPPNLVGGKFLSNINVRTKQDPNTAYEYLVGEGRIREAPQANYDIPATQFGNAINYDEGQLFNGALDRYDWKVVGKKEMIVPYNQHALLNPPEGALPWNDNFLNPDLVRFEVHRCHVVEAHLRPGARMSDPVRRFYIDEDSWHVLLSDLYDSQGNYWRAGMILQTFRPDQPGILTYGSAIWNFQSAEFVLNAVQYNAAPPLNGNIPGGVSYAIMPKSMYDPQAMANSGGL